LTSCSPLRLKSNDTILSANDPLDVIGKHLQSLAMLALIPGTSVNGSCALSNMGVTKDDAHNMRRNPKVT